MKRPIKPSAERSRQMSLVRGKHNKSTEQRYASFLRRARVTGWKRHAALPGRPDFCFPAERIAVFLDGCFWHGCPRCARPIPRANTSFWRAKIATNMRRDRRTRRLLRAQGWRVFRIWEHALPRELSVSSRVVSAVVKRREELRRSLKISAVDRLKYPSSHLGGKHRGNGITNLSH